MSKDKAMHLSASQLKDSHKQPAAKSVSAEYSTKGIEDSYIHNLQQQIYFMELEVKLLQEREKERESLTGLELTDGQPLNEHMIQLKAKYQQQKTALEKNVKETSDRTIELGKTNITLSKKLKDTGEEKDRLKDKLTIAKDQIKKEREEFRTK